MPRLFTVHPDGNFVEASDDTPFLQVGEPKHGRPIRVRSCEANMSFSDAAKPLLVSFYSTIKANLSVGVPLDYIVLERDRFDISHSRRIDGSDPHFNLVSEGWGAEDRICRPSTFRT
ncbi:MAG: hypothetical protein R3D84_16130 [Paracoccaceae bacterium]